MEKNDQLDFEVNKVVNDELDRPSGILLVDKPKGKTSNDIVYDVRREYGTKKVGHAGALDPFASGLLIILLGRATKLSDRFLTMDKEYIADVLLGVGTESGDTEGSQFSIENIKEFSDNKEFSKGKIIDVLDTFKPSYLQHVPVYSSVKVEGRKLRELARNYARFELKDIKDDSKIIQFYNAENELKKEVKLPAKEVNIYDIELLDLKELSLEELREYDYKDFVTRLKQKLPDEEISVDSKFQVARVKVSVSKGTYIRQLAIDIGERLDTSAMLIGLRRTKIGRYVV